MIEAIEDPRLQAVAAYGLPGTLTELPATPLDDDEWHDLRQKVRAQRLSGLLASAVTNDEFPVTPEQRQQVVEDHLDAMASAVLLERQLLDVIDALDDAGLDYRVLKGSGYAHLDYADPALRAFGDIDLMVRGDDFDAVVALLVAKDYQRRYPEPRPGFDRRFSKGTSFITPSGYELDLHRTFVMGPFGLGIDLDDLWTRHDSFDLAGTTVRTLAAEDRLLHAAFHAALGDAPPRLSPRRDIAEMLLFGAMDQDLIRARAGKWRAEAVLAEALRSTWATLRLADITRLSTWAHDYQVDGRDARNLSVYQAASNNYAVKSLAAIRAIPTLSDKAAFVTALALPQRTYVDGRYRGIGARISHGMREIVRGRRGPR